MWVAILDFVHTVSLLVNNTQGNYQYPHCNPIKTWPKWAHYDYRSPESISAGVNYHKVARVQEQSCTLSLIERTPPSQLSFPTTVLFCLMDLIKYNAPYSLNVPVHIFSWNPARVRGQLWLSASWASILFVQCLQVCLSWIRDLRDAFEQLPFKRYPQYLTQLGSNLK